MSNDIQELDGANSGTSSLQVPPEPWQDLRSDVLPAESPKDAEWRPFPLQALPPVMAKFAAEVGRTVCVDPAMAALPMISIAGAMVGNSLRAKMSAQYLAPANIWSAVVVRSGDRKSPVLRAIMDPIYQRQAEEDERHSQTVATYKQDIERWKAKSKKDRGDAPVEPAGYPHLFLSDTTTEAIAVRLLSQPRGLPVVLDELAGLFAGLNQYKKGGGNDRESYLAFYDAGPAKIDRKTSTPPTIYIPRAFITITGMIQPGALARSFGNAEFDSGLAARFLLASPPSTLATWNRRDITESARRGWQDLIASLLDRPLSERPELIQPSDAAMDVWAHAHDLAEVDRAGETDDRMRAARAKLIGMIPRMALIFQSVSAASGEQAATFRCIDEMSMRRAVEVVDWATIETRRVYDLLHRECDDEPDDQILNTIRQRGGVASARDLQHWTRQFRDKGGAARSKAYLDDLEREGLGNWQWMEQKGPGQPLRVFVLNSFCGNTNPARHIAERVTVTAKGAA